MHVVLFLLLPLRCPGTEKQNRAEFHSHNHFLPLRCLSTAKYQAGKGWRELWNGWVNRFLPFSQGIQRFQCYSSSVPQFFLMTSNETAFSDGIQQSSLYSLFRVYKDYINFGKWKGVILRWKFHCLRFVVPWIPHFHGEAF